VVGAIIGRLSDRFDSLISRKTCSAAAGANSYRSTKSAQGEDLAASVKVCPLISSHKTEDVSHCASLLRNGSSVDVASLLARGRIELDGLKLIGRR
jgi:hypothetical protein